MSFTCINCILRLRMHDVFYFWRSIDVLRSRVFRRPNIASNHVLLNELEHG